MFKGNLLFWQIWNIDLHDAGTYQLLFAPLNLVSIVRVKVLSGHLSGRTKRDMNKFRMVGIRLRKEAEKLRLNGRRCKHTVSE
jgi:hypothetical protein